MTGRRVRAHIYSSKQLAPGARACALSVPPSRRRRAAVPRGRGPPRRALTGPGWRPVGARPASATHATRYLSPARAPNPRRRWRRRRGPAHARAKNVKNNARSRRREAGAALAVRARAAAPGRGGPNDTATRAVDGRRGRLDVGKLRVLHGCSPRQGPSKRRPCRHGYMTQKTKSRKKQEKKKKVPQAGTEAVNQVGGRQRQGLRGDKGAVQRRRGFPP